MRIEAKWIRYAAVMSNAVFVKVLLILSGFYLGRGLDNRWGTYPFMMVLFLSLGAGIGIWWVLYVANKRKPQ